ncbi:MAG: exo 1,3/1,4-beta-D-glucan glucohydrolase [Alphaproteobacteria bacterium]|nr:exo 1,3/1,4-beta-D-glucan glucohydrolase [Alphaproteobacteria bacterium]MDE2630514.1 exo 1,3/1,4-beta-D-glucan glucohydrolase [Alphaproteobacteria bacterium]
MLRNALLVLVGALTLAACSSLPEVTSMFGTASASANQAPAAAAPQEDVDYATSADVHPDIWPAVQSGVARDPAIEAQIAAFLSQMTLEEKVGQVIQADTDWVTPDDVRKYHLGSILSGGDSGPYGNGRAPAPQWLKLADEMYNASVGVAPGHPAIPVIWGQDAVHGNSHIIGATVFPHNIGLGAMHDPDLMRRIGAVTAQELRVVGGDWTFAPTIAVVRDDRWGRTYESYSEDPRIVADYAAAIVEGIQGKPGDLDFLKGGHVIATAKHFIGDGGTDKGHDQGDNLYSEPALHDIFAPPYEAAIKVGVQSVMASFSSWRGHKMHGDKQFLTDILRGRMGFDGLVVGDWDGHAQPDGCNKYNCPDAMKAGLDMYMAPDSWKNLYGSVLAQVKAGTIPMARLDEAVGRILRVKLRAGVLSEPKPSSRLFAGQYNLLGSPDHRAVARQAVRESMVLLKNDGGILPLSPRAHVLVAGDGADNLPKQAGGWTISWQGDGNTRADFPNGNTIFEGIKANVEAAGGTATLSVDGGFAEKPDVAIVVFGENPYAEFRGDRPNVDFAPGERRDLKLLQRLRAQGIPVVSVFLSGRPLYVTPEINASQAFVAAWLPGSEGAGVADVLFSRPDGAVAYDFRGMLSFSWPRAPDQTPLNVGTEPYFPLFPYGYGLTYATPRNLGTLPEAASAAATLNTIMDTGRAAAPWSILLADTSGEKVATDPAPATLSNAALRAVRGNRNKQEDVLVATWSGVGQASLVAATDGAASFAKQTNDGMTLTMDMRVDSAPERQVTLAMGNATTLGTVDLTQALRAARGKGWTKIAVPLSCFQKAGADMSAVTLPMVLTTSGRLAIGLYFVQVEPASAQASCPAAEALRAPAAAPVKAFVKVGARTTAKSHVKMKSHVKIKSRAKPKAHLKVRKRHAK